MKLQFKNDSDNSANDSNMTIQQKVAKIMGNDSNNDTNKKGIENMKLKLKSNADNSNDNTPLDNLKLKLKKSNGINADNLELSINKFAAIETMQNKIDNIDNTFTTFLTNQNDSVKVINSFTNRLDTIELLLTNLAKNQNSILNAVNTLHGKLAKNSNAFFDNSNADTSTDKKPEVKTIKASDKKQNDSAIDTESINGIFDIFQNHFNHNNFMGDKILTDENTPIFQALMESIEIDSIDTITESIGKFRSQLTKESGKYLTARKSNKAFDTAIIKTIETINDKPFNIDESKANTETIDKGYFAKIFKTTKESISELIDDIISLDDIAESIDLISEILRQSNPNANDNEIGLFVNYVKAYAS